MRRLDGAAGAALSLTGVIVAAAIGVAITAAARESSPAAPLDSERTIALSPGPDPAAPQAPAVTTTAASRDPLRVAGVSSTLPSRGSTSTTAPARRSSTTPTAGSTSVTFDTGAGAPEDPDDGGGGHGRGRGRGGSGDRDDDSKSNSGPGNYEHNNSGPGNESSRSGGDD